MYHVVSSGEYVPFTETSRTSQIFETIACLYLERRCIQLLAASLSRAPKEVKKHPIEEDSDFREIPPGRPR
jgi:hypothetical protein